MPKRNDGFFDIFPDRDFDGDRDLCDYLFFHDEEDELQEDGLDSRAVRHPYDLFDAIQNDSDIDAEDDDFSLDDEDGAVDFPNDEPIDDDLAEDGFADDVLSDDDFSNKDSMENLSNLIFNTAISIENASENRPTKLSGESKTSPFSGISYRREEARRQRAADPKDTAQYRFCKVWLEEQSGPYYYYLIGDLQLGVGDLVDVPFGSENAVRRARVVSVGECYGFAFPCHVKLIKTVIRKIGSPNA